MPNGEKVVSLRIYYPWAKKETYSRKNLELLPREALYQIHGQLCLEQLQQVQKKWKQDNYGNHALGSYATAIVSERFPILQFSDDNSKKISLKKGEKHIEIHFAPFGILDRSDNKQVRFETMCLALADVEKLIDNLELLQKDHSLKYIIGVTNKTMAEVARTIGFSVSKSLSPELRDIMKLNKAESFNIFVDDIPLFIQNLRKKLYILKRTASNIEERFSRHGVTEESARINAILALTKPGINITE